MNPDKLTTVIHEYLFDTKKPDEAAAWEALKMNLEGRGLKAFESWGGNQKSEGRGLHYHGSHLDGVTLDLETKYLFSNQWNTGPVACAMTKGAAEQGMRVFDWALDARSDGHGRHIKSGHWLEQTPAMAEIRRNTVRCGYCGHQQPAAMGEVFHLGCLDSPYLKESDLLLTRMVPVADDDFIRRALTDAERAYLLPLYMAAQTTAVGSRAVAAAAKRRERVEKKFREETYSAKTEHDGMIWLLDHGWNTENVIYYSHTDRFCFGWREPIGKEVLSKLLDMITEFPHSYDIKTTPDSSGEGRTLSGER